MPSDLSDSTMRRWAVVSVPDSVAEATATDLSSRAAPLVHIGFHKTGTTWLQQHLFAADALGFMPQASEQRIKRRLVLPHDLDFDPGVARAYFRPLLERASDAGLVGALSAERLCGDMLFGAYDSARIAERIAATLPDARVLMVVREQRSMLLATYAQYVRLGGTLPLDRYLDRPRRPHPWPCDLRHFEYDRLIAKYHELLGPERVLALPYELFRRDPRSFVGAVVGFAQARSLPGALDRLPFDEVANGSPGTAAIEIKRVLNRLVRERVNHAAPLEAKSRAGRACSALAGALAGRIPDTVAARRREQLRETIDRIAGDRYCDSNERTASLTGLDLAAFGYRTWQPHAETGAAHSCAA